jgi:Na+-transporting NADH:ubiquinone oxidoreductase subunit A
VRFKIKRGLDIPLAGVPDPVIRDGPRVRTAGLIGLDYLGLKAALEVKPGDRVRLGQCLFTDKKNPRVRYVAPAAGEVSVIHRGARRVLQSVVIRIDAGRDREHAQLFDRHSRSSLEGLGRDQAIERLLGSGLWTALRGRPFSTVPDPASVPDAIFVNAMDTNPLAPDPFPIIAAEMEAFADGLRVLSGLTEGRVFVCSAPHIELKVPASDRVVRAEFDGPHPAGLPGTHIHFLYPVDAQHAVWTIGYQDVIAFGKLFTAGEIWTERVAALAGPGVKHPRLVRTRLGAAVDDLLAGELPDLECRVISGSVIAGRRAAGWGAYLGRYHNQITVLAEGRQRELFGWIKPGFNKFSSANVFMSSIVGRGRRFPLSTSQNGSARAMVPIGVYESVMPQDLLPTPLLRALLIRDTEAAQKLGCLELDEEDLALCSFVCPSKYDFGPALRASLERIEREG